MTKEEIEGIIHKRCSNAKLHFSKLLRDFDIDAIHDFRVEIKKLRAFIRMLNCGLTEAGKISLGSRLKSFYTTTGNIRNIQLQQKKIEDLCAEMKLNIPGQYLLALKKELKKEKQNAKDEAKQLSFSHFEKRTIHDLPSEIEAETIQRFLTQKQEALTYLLAVSYLTDENLHSIRKQLKDLFYNGEYLSNYEIILPSVIASKESLEKITRKLGDFHDICVAIYLLHPLYINTVTDLKEEKILEQLKSELVNRKVQMKNELETIFHSGDKKKIPEKIQYSNQVH